MPPPDVLEHTEVGRFIEWLHDNRGLDLSTHDELWRFSVSDLDGFWSAIWDFFDVGERSGPVLARREMPGAVWFPQVRLNYAGQALRWLPDEHSIVVQGRSQTRPDVDLTGAQLWDQVSRAQTVLRGLGVGPGDRVVGYLPNVPEALVAFLATVSLGAIWASCASELGVRSVVDRFAQIQPTVLIAAGGYTYGVKAIDRIAQIDQIRGELPTVRYVLDIEYGQWRVTGAASWPELLAAAEPEALQFTEVPFEHPLVVLFSSGTTGPPKAIVHGHGGILLEHLKNHALSWDLAPGDRIQWYTTTSWMMWNALVSALLVRAGLVMLDGDPAYPDLSWQWQVAQDTRATLIGASPGFVMACRAAGVDLSGFDLAARVIGSAGSPLPPEGYAWIRDQLGAGVQLNVGSGGTDVCSGLVQNNPLLPVLAGRISGCGLGVDAHAFDESGYEVIGQPGELVITSPMPSMPVGFWGDESGERLRATYFDTYPGIWRHGDWVVFDTDGSCVVTGRSDATLNRGGVRLGTAEFYRVVEELDGVTDSLVVHLENSAGGNGHLVLFVVTATGELTAELRARIVSELRQGLSPRHVPDEILVVPAVPRNLTGKKLELPVKRILQGADPDTVAARGTLADPASLDAYIAFASRGIASRGFGTISSAGAR